MKDSKDQSIGMNINQKYKQKKANYQTLTIFPLDASFQGVNRLFVLAFNNTDGNANQVESNSHRK